jgi:HlyD family secretion protein
VVSRAVDVGQTVAASFQTPTLFEIAQDLTKMQVNANVSESDIGGLREGLAASWSTPTRTQFEGRSCRCATPDHGAERRDLRRHHRSRQPRPRPQARHDRHRDDHDRPPRGRAARGAARAALPARERRRGGAARRYRATADGAGVFVLDGGGELRRVELRTGLRDELWAEVLEGELAPGAAVAVAYRRPLEKSAPAQSPFLPARRR